MAAFSGAGTLGKLEKDPSTHPVMLRPLAHHHGLSSNSTRLCYSAKYCMRKKISLVFTSSFSDSILKSAQYPSVDLIVTIQASESKVLLLLLAIFIAIFMEHVELD